MIWRRRLKKSSLQRQRNSFEWFLLALLELVSPNFSLHMMYFQHSDCPFNFDECHASSHCTRHRKRHTSTFNSRQILCLPSCYWRYAEGTSLSKDSLGCRSQEDHGRWRTGQWWHHGGHDQGSARKEQGLQEWVSHLYQCLQISRFALALSRETCQNDDQNITYQAQQTERMPMWLCMLIIFCNPDSFPYNFPCPF